MKYSFFIGVDVSKATLDFCLLSEGKSMFHLQASNDQRGIKEFLKQCKQFNGFDVAKAVFCMEHTGIYNNPLLEFLSRANIDAWLGKPRLNHPFILNILPA